MRAWMIGVLLALGAGTMGSGAAQAEPVLCATRINGVDAPLAYDRAEDGLRTFYSLREIVHTSWGRDTCPSYVVLRALTPELTDAERSPFCVRYDKDSDSIIGYDVGRRDAYGRCKAPRKSVCQRVNQTKDAAVSIAGGAARRTFNGVETARNSTAGAVILSGSKQYVGQALGAIGGAAASLATAPAVAAGAAVTVVAVGGAVYACSGEEAAAAVEVPADSSAAPEAPAATEMPVPSEGQQQQ